MVAEEELSEDQFLQLLGPLDPVHRLLELASKCQLCLARNQRNFKKNWGKKKKKKVRKLVVNVHLSA